MNSDDNKTMDADSESSSDQEDEITEGKKVRADELDAQLSNYAFSYESHLEIVKLYKELADLESLRTAYKRFYETYPLTNTLWLEWINIEIQLATSDSEKKNVLSLFDRATKDYLSIQLWLEYLQYAIGACSPEECRAIFAKAITAGGLHYTDGSLIWDTWREYELAQLACLDSESEAHKAQIKCVADIFKRQLAVPLVNLEALHLEWEEFTNMFPDSGIDKKSVDWGYKNALKGRRAYEPFEEKILGIENDQELCQIFIDYAKSIEDPTATFALFERAVEKLCLFPEIWIAYCNFAFKFGDSAGEISAKAVRNVSWHDPLWVLRLQILENCQKPEEDVMKCFEHGLTCIPQNLNFWLAYLEYASRNWKNEEKLFKLFDQAVEQVGEHDFGHKIRIWYARLAVKGEKIDKFKEIWKDILRDSQMYVSATCWLEYIMWFRFHTKNIADVRQLFKKAVGVVKDWPIMIADEWMKFERECGTLDGVMKCFDMCRKIQTAVSVEVPPIAEKKCNSASKTIKKGSKPLEFDSKGGRLHTESRKRPSDSEVDDSPKRAKVLRKTKVPPADLEPEKTVFVSNLSGHVTETDLEPLFPSSRVTLIYGPDDKSRCYGYIQFNSESEVTDTLKRDREVLGGRPMFLSKCKVDCKERDKPFKYSNREEKNKLFVKGLSFKYTQNDVEALFKPYNPKSVRLVTQRDGKTKGIAYVDFDNEKDPIKAIDDLNDKEFDGHTISVAISAPPPKRDKAVLGPKKAAPGERKPPNLGFALLPTSVLNKQKEKDKGDVAPAVIAKTNEDFRKMLLEKK